MKLFRCLDVLCHFCQSQVPLQMIKGMVVSNAFCLAFTFSNIFRLTLWSIFKQVENRHSKQGKYFLAVIKLDVLGSNKVSQIPRAVKLLQGAALLYLEWEIVRSQLGPVA